MQLCEGKWQDVRILPSDREVTGVVAVVSE